MMNEEIDQCTIRKLIGVATTANKDEEVTVVCGLQTFCQGPSTYSEIACQVELQGTRVLDRRG